VGAKYGSDAVRYEEVFERGVISFWRGGRGLFEVLRFPQSFCVVFCGGWVVESCFLRTRFLGLKIFLVFEIYFLGAFRKGDGLVPLDSTPFQPLLAIEILGSALLTKDD
jgi:hypothetical protein